MAAAPMRAAWRRVGAIEHGFTHFALRLDVYFAEVGAIQGEGFVVPSGEVEAEALASVMRKCVRLIRGRLPG
jgi:A/G-specific adenine glycosylase